VDGSDYSEEDESGDDDDDAAKNFSKHAPKSRSTLGKRKAEFNSRKPKRECFPPSLCCALLIELAMNHGAQVDLE
jgi:hypothetical protein